jgi:EAL domain-containing protein (putative c-di-GMP-specific phosphodiesterase class I)
MALFYQPLVSCVTGTIEGYEALLRWNHPIRGFVSPVDFIPIAEESGLILALGQWVIETACATAAAWDRPLRVAVNLSPAQFKQTDLVNRIMTTLTDTGLQPERLEVEVTEGVLINDPERAISILSDLRALGVKISLDDFGTGYSSLSYLRQFPLDKIKIDRSFIVDVGQDERSAPIVRAVVALAHSLGLTVTAEGVETQGQLDLLQGQSCNQVQGFLLGRPAPLGLPAAARAGESCDAVAEHAVA